MYNTAKFLAKILRPLVGHNGHHIINSEDFTNKIADLEVPPGQKLVSYDVSALFTSIPINEAIPVVRPNFPTAKKAQSASNVRKALPKRLLRRLR